MTMRKRIIIHGMAALLTLGVLTACGEDKKKDMATPIVPTPAPVKPVKPMPRK